MNREDEDLAEAVAQMRAAISRARGYADFFGWPDRALAEYGVVESLAESLAATGATFFTDAKSRDAHDDPPDCEALSLNRERVAIEVTELVSGAAIKANKAGGSPVWAEWDTPSLRSAVSAALQAKDAKFPNLRGGPYPGGYVVLIFSDEPLLPFSELAEPALSGHAFTVANISRAFVLLSYVPPPIGRCPYVELLLNRPDTR